MNFSLNRYSLIGNINYNTPVCVIQEIMLCLGNDISIEDIEKQRNIIVDHIISNDESIEIKDEYSQEELDRISIFVSKKETLWDRENLMKAFRHIVNYNNIIPENFTYGEKTNHNPISYDSTMLYAFCLENNIRTNSTDTINELAVYARLSFAKRHVLLDTLTTKITKLDNCGLINVLKETKFSSTDEFVYSDNTGTIISKIKNIDNPLSRTLLTNEEAIVYAAKRYNIDITESSCPSNEFLEITKKEYYKPITKDRFFEYYNLNPYYYDLTKFWKPKLSQLYSDKMLSNLLNNECVNYKEISDPKQFLYELTLTKNVYIGIIPGMEYHETFVYKTPFSELNNKHIISYGVINSNDIIALTADEITKFLRLHKEFRDFRNEGEILSERNLKKITMICKMFPHEEKFIELLDTIRETKVHGSIMNAKIKEFVTYTKNLDPETYDKINNILDKIFECSMFMRGWEEGKEYPMSVKDCENYAMRYDEIETRVLDSVRFILESINNLNDTTKMLIKSLPLIKISEKDKSYYKSTNPDEGLSFYDRLMIISTTPESIYGCLRLSSNYLASSAQYYNILLNGKTYIDITKLEFIQ